MKMNHFHKKSENTVDKTDVGAKRSDAKVDYDRFHQKVDVVNNITRAFEAYHAEMRTSSFSSKIKGLFKNEYEDLDLQIKEMLNLKIQLSNSILDSSAPQMADHELAAIDIFFKIWLTYQFLRTRKNEADIMSMLSAELNGSIDEIGKDLRYFYEVILRIEKNKRVIENLYDFAFSILEMILNRDFDLLVNQK